MVARRLTSPFDGFRKLGRRGAGGGAPPPGVAPTITGLPLSDGDITILGTPPITFHYLDTTSLTPPANSTIKAAPDSRVLAGGTNYLADLIDQTTPGTWYRHFLAANAAGDSPVETESYVVAAPAATPRITGQTELNGFGSTAVVAIPATVAGDSILIVASAAGASITASAPNFVTRASISTGTYCIYILEWDGGGSRPNSSNVTVTFSAGVNNCTMGFVIEQALGIAGTSASTASSTSHTLNTITTAGSALTFAAAVGGNVAQTPTGPGTPPSLDPTLPADAGYWTVARSGNFQLYVYAYETPDPGQTDAITLTTGSATSVRYAVTAVEAL